MLNYLRESLYWLHLTFCKPVTLRAKAVKLPKQEALIAFLKTYFLAMAIYTFIVILVGSVAMFLGKSFNWNGAAKVLPIAWGASIIPGLAGIWMGNLHLGLTNSVLLFGLLSGLILPLGGSLGGGYGFVVPLMCFGLALGTSVLLPFYYNHISERSFRLIGGGIGFALALLSDWKQIALKPEFLIYFCLSFLAFLSTYFRVFYLLPYLWQYTRAAKANDPFKLFHNSPIYWDEAISSPLPNLKDWLGILVKRDRKRGLEEIVFVAEHCPFQRKAALRALLDVAEERLHRVHDLSGLAEIPNLLEAFPAEDNASPKSVDDAGRRLNTISTLAKDYQSRLTVIGQLKVLEELRGELESFHTLMKLTVAPVGTIFQPLATRWLEMVKQAEDETNKRLQFNPLPNLYVAGAPLQERDFGLLKGRRDIIRTIEKDVLNTDQRPALLLYGRRRTGKSSTLLNLPRLLSSQFEPVYIDCQDAKWHESDQAFCYNLAREIFERLFQSDDVKGIRQPQWAQFEKNAFTRLDEYLDQFERLATERGKRILLAFDEYEGLEESIAGGDISKNVLGKLRNIIQHRQRIVVLVSGSHRFEELTGVNWASYLINTRTLELSFLDEPSARELLTEPVPQLRYEDGVLEEILRLTRCQPYLLQAVASELVNHLNELQKTTATRADLDAAVNKVLTSAGAYFANTWREDNSATEQTVLRAYAEGAGERVAGEEFHAALQSLIRKEMMERDGDDYRLTVPLFGLWILRNQVD